MRGPSAGGKEKIELGKFRFQRMTLQCIDARKLCSLTMGRDVSSVWGGQAEYVWDGQGDKTIKSIKKGHLSH